MASNSSDVEHLLNTIVAARVRLSGLRGEQTGQRDPSLPTAPAIATAPAPKSDWPHEETNTFPMGADDLPAKKDLLLNDDLPADEETQDHIEDTLILGIDPLEDDPFDIDEAPLDPPSSAEDDPFSFIDLLPPEDLNKAEESPVDLEPSVEPPPVREKPKMPLPLGRAAGAPASTVQSTPPPKPIIEPPPSLEVREPHLENEPVVRHLHAPKKVEPRILDPNRSVLEVDVFEDEVFDEPTFDPPAEAPRLTEAVKPQLAATTRREPHRTEDELFDTITDAMSLLSKGDLRAAHQLFSDVLDWIPDHIEARLARGRCNRDLGDTVSALSDFRRAHMQAKYSPAPHIEIGDLFFAKKDYLRAAAHYDDALAIDPQNALTLCRRGICHHHRKRPEQAAEDLIMAQKINPEIPNIDRYIRMVQPGRK